MSGYSDWMPVAAAARRFGGRPGNYLLRDYRGHFYPGRQGPGQNRIARHMRKHPGEFILARFWIDRRDDQCARAAREHAAVTAALYHRIPLRNLLMPAIPSVCPVPRAAAPRARRAKRPRVRRTRRS